MLLKQHVTTSTYYSLYDSTSRTNVHQTFKHDRHDERLHVIYILSNSQGLKLAYTCVFDSNSKVKWNARFAEVWMFQFHTFLT